MSKSSAALNTLTITQLACEPRDMSRTALRGPDHQLAVRMRIIITTHPSNNQPCASNRAEGLHFIIICMRTAN